MATPPTRLCYLTGILASLCAGAGTTPHPHEGSRMSDQLGPCNRTMRALQCLIRSIQPAQAEPFLPPPNRLAALRPALAAPALPAQKEPAMSMLRLTWPALVMVMLDMASARAGDLLTPAKPIEQAVDHYIDTRLKQAGVMPVSLADDANLVRRLTLDLTGRI